MGMDIGGDLLQLLRRIRTLFCDLSTSSTIAITAVWAMFAACDTVEGGDEDEAVDGRSHHASAAAQLPRHGALADLCFPLLEPATPTARCHVPPDTNITRPDRKVHNISLTVES